MQEIFSTTGLHTRNSFKRWREALVERIVPVEITKLGELPFEGKLEGAIIGGMNFSRVTQGAVRIETHGHLRRNMNDTLAVAITLSGARSLELGSSASIQREGEFVVLDRRPATIFTTAKSRSLIIEVPRFRFEAMLGPTRLYAGLTIGATQASTTLATTYLNELVRVCSRLEPASTERMSSIGVDLIVASIAERLAQEVPRPIHRTVVLQRAKAYVEANLGDSALDPPLLAAAMGVSLRRLQELFHERGHHISDWIWQRRLAVAATRLADPSCDHLSIGALAYCCGFSSQAHFSRRFKERYNMTPSEYRHSTNTGPR